mgnify:CR=1 FL=1
MMRAKDNPFRSQRLNAIGYISQDEPLRAICERLEEMKSIVAVVGPHGSGKSTLLRHLQKRFDSDGYRTHQLFISRDVKLPWKRVTECVETMRPSEVLFFDGANHLPTRRFCRLKKMIRKKDAGLVITSHTEGLLPTLVQCRTNPDLLKEIVSRLLPDEPVESWKSEALFHQHHGNIRDCLWQLYDEYGSSSYQDGCKSYSGSG